MCMNMHTQRTHDQLEANLKHVPSQLLTKFLVLARVLEAIGVQVHILLVATSTYWSPLLLIFLVINQYPVNTISLLIENIQARLEILSLPKVCF